MRYDAVLIYNSYRRFGDSWLHTPVVHNLCNCLKFLFLVCKWSIRKFSFEFTMTLVVVKCIYRASYRKCVVTADVSQRPHNLPDKQCCNESISELLDWK